MEVYQFVCGGCGTEYKDLDDIDGTLKKSCNHCGYSLFMITHSQFTGEPYNQSIFMLSKQHEMLSFIQEYVKLNKYTPSIKEIQQALNFKSVSTVYYHLNLLKEKGYITFKQGRLNTLKILPKAIHDQDLLPLSDKQISLLMTISDYFEKKGCSPTNQELQQLLGFKSIATLVHHLNRLQEFSLIEKTRYRHRSIVLTKKGNELVQLLKSKEVSG